MLETSRLLIKPFTLAMMRAAVKGPATFRQVAEVNVEAGYPAADYLAMFPFKIEHMTANPEALAFECFVILKETNTIMADIGFKGGPDAAGRMDIGYSVMPRYRGCGLATEMVKAMTAWGKRQPGVKTLTAHCDKANQASYRVLRNAGFHMVKETEDGFYFEINA